MKLIIGVAVTILFSWFVLRNVWGDDLARALAATDLRFLWLMLVSIAGGILLRATRWWLMLRRYSPSLTWTGTARVFSLAIALNNVLPFRLGEVSRLVAFRGSETLTWSRVGGTLVAEKLLDLTALAMILWLVLSMNSGLATDFVKIAQWVTGFIALALVLVFVSAPVEKRITAALRRIGFIANSKFLTAALDRIGEVIEAATSLGSPARLAGFLLLSLLGWLAEGVLFILVVHATAASGGVAAGMLALAMATLGTALPSSPGYVGTFHFFAAQAVSAFGTPATIAVAYAIVVHFILWAATTIPLIFLIPSVAKLAPTEDDIRKTG